MKRIIRIGKAYTMEYAKIEMSLRKNNKDSYVFSVSGLAQYDKEIKDYCSGGQNLDTILQMYPENELVKEVYRLWKLYHLNDMNAGTIEQEQHLKSLGKYQDYDWACEELKKVNLYEIPLEQGITYKYGSAWLLREIPKNDLDKIKRIIN
tara:strand:+ start:737 stop:1186 length:450 start_codon:yes stop_codon:yes gene_type:complete